MDEIKISPPNILSILEEVLLKEEDDYKKSHEYRYRHNPSSAMVVAPEGGRIGACMRAMWYKATQEPESNPRDFSSRLTSGFGNAIHAWFSEKLQKSKKLAITSEVPGKMLIDPLTKEISFRLDGLVTYRGAIGGFELKTGMGFPLQKMVKTTGPNPKDILQCLSYFGTNEAIQWFVLVYVARDSGFRAEYHMWKEDGKFYIKGIVPTMRTKEINYLSFPQIVESWKQLESHIESGIPPARDYKVVFADDGRIVPHRIKKGYKYVTDKACIWCSWQKTCWSAPGALDDAVKIGESKTTTKVVNASPVA